MLAIKRGREVATSKQVASQEFCFITIGLARDFSPQRIKEREKRGRKKLRNRNDSLFRSGRRSEKREGDDVLQGQ